MAKAKKTVQSTQKKLPFHGGQQCYACDCQTVVGLRDRRPEGGSLEIACARHADPTVATYDACMYCDAPARKGSWLIDGNFAHKTCHDMVVNDTFHKVMDQRFERARIKRSR
jgi:hypothetical protein